MFPTPGLGISEMNSPTPSLLPIRETDSQGEVAILSPRLAELELQPGTLLPKPAPFWPSLCFYEWAVWPNADHGVKARVDLESDLISECKISLVTR